MEVPFTSLNCCKDLRGRLLPTQSPGHSSPSSRDARKVSSTSPLSPVRSPSDAQEEFMRDLCECRDCLLQMQAGSMGMGIISPAFLDAYIMYFSCLYSFSKEKEVRAGECPPILAPARTPRERRVHTELAIVLYNIGIIIAHQAYSGRMTHSEGRYTFTQERYEMAAATFDFIRMNPRGLPLDVDKLDPGHLKTLSLLLLAQSQESEWNSMVQQDKKRWQTCGKAADLSHCILYHVFEALTVLQESDYGKRAQLDPALQRQYQALLAYTETKAIFYKGMRKYLQSFLPVNKTKVKTMRKKAFEMLQDCLGSTQCPHVRKEVQGVLYEIQLQLRRHGSALHSGEVGIQPGPQPTPLPQSRVARFISNLGIIQDYQAAPTPPDPYSGELLEWIGVTIPDAQDSSQHVCTVVRQSQIMEILNSKIVAHPTGIRPFDSQRQAYEVVHFLAQVTAPRKHPPNCRVPMVLTILLDITLDKSREDACQQRLRTWRQAVKDVLSSQKDLLPEDQVGVLVPRAVDRPCHLHPMTDHALTSSALEQVTLAEGGLGEDMIAAVEATSSAAWNSVQFTDEVFVVSSGARPRTSAAVSNLAECLKRHPKIKVHCYGLGDADAELLSAASELSGGDLCLAPDGEDAKGLREWLAQRIMFDRTLVAKEVAVEVKCCPGVRLFGADDWSLFTGQRLSPDCVPPNQAYVVPLRPPHTKATLAEGRESAAALCLQQAWRAHTARQVFAQLADAAMSRVADPARLQEKAALLQRVARRQLPRDRDRGWERAGGGPTAPSTARPAAPSTCLISALATAHMWG